MNQTLADFESKLRSHDWTYQYSDDHAVWRRGQAEREAIAAQLIQLKSQGLASEAEALYKQYSPFK